MSDFLEEIYRTHKRVVYALVCAGTHEPLEYYKSLPDQARGRYLNIFLRVCNLMPLTRDRYHKLTKPHKGKVLDLWEFKDISSKTRFLSFNDNYQGRAGSESRIIITNGYFKNEDDLDPREIDISLRGQEYYYKRTNMELVDKDNGRKRKG